ncbi:hypothetical protein N7457_000275 [Penicillium paradoxum]|uniref:uncharacterized protein n=1 Tax=Penicillium paradoxum TaxID=176176 RepID=UPI002548E7AA|nr:uncharacterized protein N7457_000275 [Penicillium paradoxum]KAJ5793676.1 hypothetical protein N7457_000275 [Penicillium paradoxum]
MAWYSILPADIESWAAHVFVSFRLVFLVVPSPLLDDAVANLPRIPQFLLGLITIGPWAFLVLLDATIWIYRLILWEVPWIGGRARGRQRPRAPSLNERPGGQRRAFGLRGVETDTGDSEGPDQDDSSQLKNEKDGEDSRKQNVGSAAQGPKPDLIIRKMAEALYNKLDIGWQRPLLPITYLLSILIVGVCIYQWRGRESRNASASGKTKTTYSDEKQPSITPLEGFDWQKTKPLQLRPFKGKDKYNLTMAIETLDPSELIQIDKTYKDRIALRKSVVHNHHDIVVAINNDQTPAQDPRIRPAIGELYTFVLRTYLPTRYPSMFQLNPDSSIFQNLVTGEAWPTTLSPTTPTIQALEILAQTVDEDFLILLPELSRESEEQPRYVLQAYATCFPAGFNTRKKLGLRLVDIHGPVPGYGEKIERSMDRFFARIEVGTFVKRANWSVTIDTGLFAAFGGTHAVSGKKEEAIKPEELDVDKTFLRSERQTLYRLPVSRAVVFGVHTYVYPVRQIKDEGLGEEFANAIDGLKKGNVPDMHIYKRGDVWGEALKQFLRT